ncbi:hypothetical protein LTR97_009228 [Elasticomyces elasticus]|uniref:Uncharacterized protein n=1 Tax=Elasticomyces elasticus TaxID=574655 RepID=A0AAN7ZM23_9PEZI|nr:hypothetical protein LTR97_009228 [Elasticomyces elasticus]
MSMLLQTGHESLVNLLPGQRLSPWIEGKASGTLLNDALSSAGGSKSYLYGFRLGGCIVRTSASMLGMVLSVVKASLGASLQVSVGLLRAVTYTSKWAFGMLTWVGQGLGGLLVGICQGLRKATGIWGTTCVTLLAVYSFVRAETWLRWRVTAWRAHRIHTRKLAALQAEHAVRARIEAEERMRREEKQRQQQHEEEMRRRAERVRAKQNQRQQRQPAQAAARQPSAAEIRRKYDVWRAECEQAFSPSAAANYTPEPPEWDCDNEECNTTSRGLRACTLRRTHNLQELFSSTKDPTTLRKDMILWHPDNAIFMKMEKDGYTRAIAYATEIAAVIGGLLPTRSA